MNLFIYDDFLKRHTKKVSQIEASLHNLNLSGKIIYLGGIKKIDDLIKAEISTGARNIIAVGNNRTISKILNVIMTVDVKTLNSLSLGIIPVGENNSIAASWGVNSEKNAAHIILARRVEKLDVAYANDDCFISGAQIKAKGTTLKIKDFTIDPIKNGQISLFNILPQKCSSKNISANPQDGLLDLYIDTGNKKPSFFAVKELEIETSNKEKLILDEAIETELPAKIGIIGHRLNIIVGRDRTFNLD
ncbi:MAG TPA: diacylglycerol kinase family protein [bacterium]|nr:diacylglycerol kinase family protein [bacterium]HPT29471.1 diacylglycerol kinase family protein [bacterium]